MIDKQEQRIIDGLTNEEIANELRKRYRPYRNTPDHSMISIDFARKVDIIFENIERLSYDELHEIFTTKKY